MEHFPRLALSGCSSEVVTSPEHGYSLCTLHIGQHYTTAQCVGLMLRLWTVIACSFTGHLLGNALVVDTGNNLYVSSSHLPLWLTAKLCLRESFGGGASESRPVSLVVWSLSIPNNLLSFAVATWASLHLGTYLASTFRKKAL